MKCLTWNIEWAVPRSKRGKRIKQIVHDINPDLICYTEATLGMVPDGGHVITADPDYGYPNKGDRHKVLLWSRQPLEDVDQLGNAELPGGRFVSGITYGIRFVGVCIPWRDAHVRTGRKDRSRWQDHRHYLDAFAPLSKSFCKSTVPDCVTGDFNQRIPRFRQPLDIAQRLLTIFDREWHIATASSVDQNGQQMIDHVAACGTLSTRVEQILPKRSVKDLPLSDHVGILFSIKG